MMTQFSLTFLLDLALFSLPAPPAFPMDLPRVTQRSSDQIKMVSYNNKVLLISADCEYGLWAVGGCGFAL